MAAITLERGFNVAGAGGIRAALAQPTAANPVGVTLICLAVVLVITLLVLVFNEYRARLRKPQLARKAAKAEQNLPEGKIVYQDADGAGEPLLAIRYPLSGKPDYVVLSPEGVPIPVELKLSQESEEAQSHHVMQVAAYFVILEDLYAQPPSYGVLRYANKDFTIRYTDALKRKVARRLAEMERCDERHPPSLAQQLPSKCNSCPFQPVCPIGLRQ